MDPEGAFGKLRRIYDEWSLQVSDRKLFEADAPFLHFPILSKMFFARGHDTLVLVGIE